MKVSEANKKMEHSLKKKMMEASARDGMNRYILMEQLVAGTEKIVVLDPKSDYAI